MKITNIFALAAVLLALPACPETHVPAAEGSETVMADGDKVIKSEAQWRKELTPEQYRILREKGTEPAFTGTYHDTKEPGMYVCAGCGQPLFSSETKYDSCSGWPSFYAPLDRARIAEEVDVGFGMIRTEVLCSRCGGHLGHVFNDGPQPTGQRYCINSAALKHHPKE